MEGSDALMRVWSLCLFVCWTGGLHHGVGVMMPDFYSQAVTPNPV